MRCVGKLLLLAMSFIVLHSIACLSVVSGKVSMRLM
jgi:hypothetical protein